MEILLGALTLALFLIHVTAGERGCARPMLAADYDAVARWTMYACWHAVSAQLLLGGGALLWAGVADAPLVGRVLVAAVSSVHLVYAGLFGALILRSRLERGWLKLGQWMAFLPLGVVGWWSVLS
ncbi:MAG: hypothetical protein ACFCGT_05245 [Sandaracinaceae bacterium]